MPNPGGKATPATEVQPFGSPTDAIAPCRRHHEHRMILAGAVVAERPEVSVGAKGSGGRSLRRGDSPGFTTTFGPQFCLDGRSNLGIIQGDSIVLPPSSSGLGLRVLSPATGVRVPLGVFSNKREGNFSRFFCRSIPLTDRSQEFSRLRRQPLFLLATPQRRCPLGSSKSAGSYRNPLDMTVATKQGTGAGGDKSEAR